MPSLSTLIPTCLLPALVLGSPTPLSQLQADICTPTSYTITNYTYSARADRDAHISFNLASTWSDLTPIEDPIGSGAICSVDAPSGTIPNSNECSPGRSLLFDLRAPQQNGEFQITHTWHCNGEEWMSGSPHKIVPLQCQSGADGTVTCNSEPQSFKPQNVRRICGTPTCS